MKSFAITVITSFGLICCFYPLCAQQQHTKAMQVEKVVIDDHFWKPKMQLWASTTINDVFDKFEGKHKASVEERARNNAFLNFNQVAEGKVNTGKHVGFPWFDGLVYETIRGASDYLKHIPDPKLESRIDHYIDAVGRAQNVRPDHYLNTYTQLVEPGHEWGENGGFLRWQHDVYNAGMLVEAGVHYYKATGKTKLLSVAVKLANLMTATMGTAPKKNIIPAHAGPEEAMMKLYWLFKEEPDLKKKLEVAVIENNYYQLATFWIENRGNHSGFPLWAAWGNEASEKWIKDTKNQAKLVNSRPTWGNYAQDSVSVFQMPTIEGHAVRATLLATGMAAAASENKDSRYLQTLHRWWNNMVGKKMFITGGVGAIHFDEKFGADYYLPTDAYLETCAAVGSGYFHKRMFDLTQDGKYIDELERVLYNSLLTGISLSGDNYTYQNPLNAHNHKRWDWHECPCCPPMFLKITSELPDYIYSIANEQLYVNLFVGGEARLQLKNRDQFVIRQETEYPWKGKVALTVETKRPQKLPVHIRIPGWAIGKENPLGLYTSDLNTVVKLFVNGRPHKISIDKGYAVLNQLWKSGDRIELVLPVEPRVIEANRAVKDLQRKVALASGPLIYCLEEDNQSVLDAFQFPRKVNMQLLYNSNLLNGVNTISVKDKTGKHFSAIPYYTVGNRKEKTAYRVWLSTE